MLRMFCVVGYLVLCLQGVLADTIHLSDSDGNGIQLNAAGNSVHELPFHSHNFAADDLGLLQQILGTLEQLWRTNRKLRQELKRTTTRMMGLVRAHKRDKAKIWTQLKKTAAQVKSCSCLEEMKNLQQKIGDMEDQLKMSKRPSAKGPAFYLSGFHPSSRTTTESVVLPGTQASSVLVTEEGTILIADQSRQELLMTSLQHINEPPRSQDFHLTPWSMAQLQDGTVAVTWVEKPRIAILRIAEGPNRLRTEWTITTERKYRGVTQCGEAGGISGRLIVSAYRESDVREARIDVITRDGVVHESLLSGKDFEDLLAPFFLACRNEEDLYVSDWSSQRVLVLNTRTRLVTSSFGSTDLSHLSLYRPRQVVFDQYQTMYVVTGGEACASSSSSSPTTDKDEENDGGFCILQVTADGRWRNLSTVLPGDAASDSVIAVSIAGSKMVIAMLAKDGSRFTKLVVFDLRFSQDDSLGWPVQVRPASKVW